MKTLSTKEEILNRLKQAYNLQKDTELAVLLGVSKSTLSNWVSRDSMDYDKVFSLCEHISIDWLLTGRGSMHKEDALQNPQPTENISKEAPVYYNMYKEERAENRALIEEIGALKQQIKDLQDKINAMTIEDVSPLKKRRQSKYPAAVATGFAPYGDAEWEEVK